MKTNTLRPELLHKMDAYWRAANYLSVDQIYLYANPLPKRPLMLADVKHMLLGHWGTTPGQNFIYVHLNRVIKKYDLDMIYVSGPGHGGPAAEFPRRARRVPWREPSSGQIPHLSPGVVQTGAPCSPFRNGSTVATSAGDMNIS